MAMFLPIFVADIKNIYSYNFVSTLRGQWNGWLLLELKGCWFESQCCALLGFDMEPCNEVPSKPGFKKV